MNKKQILSLSLATLSAITMFFSGCGSFTDEKQSSSSQKGKPIYQEPSYTIDEAFISTNQPNDSIFDVKNTQKVSGSYLEGKTIYWLGSSVTYGSASEGKSMADYLAKMTSSNFKKDAVSGTTIFDDNLTADTGEKSYTRRLVNSNVFDKNEKVDAFVCQISTNDARNNRLTKRGAMTEDMVDKEELNRATTLGGVEYIIKYVKETWDCPVYFYSGSYFANSGPRKSTNPLGTEYAKLIDQIKEIAEKYNGYWGYHVGIIDLYNDPAFNIMASDRYYSWVMSDAIHPKAAGYQQWWTPYFESYLSYDLALWEYENA